MQLIKNPNKNNWSTLLKRPTQSLESIEKTVNQIFEDVKRNGDAAISKYTAMFDGATIENCLVTDEEIETAIKAIPENLKQAISVAKQNIETFHKAQKTDRVEVETTKGV